MTVAIVPSPVSEACHTRGSTGSRIDSMELNRRRLLGMSGLIVAASVVPMSAGCALIRDDDGLSALAADFDGSILLPNDSGFALAAWPNNANYAGVIPKAVAICVSTADISRCISWVNPPE